MKIFYSLCSVLACASSVYAFEPNVVCKTTSVELNVDVGEKRTVDFVVGNEGSAELTLGNFTANCGCIAPPIERITIKPGGAEIIKLTYSPSFKVGVFKYETVCETNDPGQAILKLAIIVNVSTVLDYKFDNGYIESGEGRTTTDVLHLKYPDNIEVLKIDSDLLNFTITEKKRNTLIYLVQPRPNSFDRSGVINFTFVVKCKNMTTNLLIDRHLEYTIYDGISSDFIQYPYVLLDANSPDMSINQELLDKYTISCLSDRVGVIPIKYNEGMKTSISFDLRSLKVDQFEDRTAKLVFTSKKGGRENIVPVFFIHRK